MNNTKLIFYDYSELYEIFYELKQFLKFELSNIESKEDLNIETKKVDNYLIISKKIHPNINNQLIAHLNENTCVAHLGDYYKKEVMDIIQAQKV